MPAIAVNQPFPLFTDADGQPLDDAYIYIGAANQNPVSNPITVYWDAALTIAAAQPIRTSGGYPVRNGSPARFYTNSDYSILVRDKNGAFVYTAASETDFISSEFVTFVQSGTGAVQRTVQSKLRDVVSVRDFGTTGDGVTDDTAAFLAANDAALAASRSLYLPAGTYGLKAPIPWKVNVIGEGMNVATIKALSGFVGSYQLDTNAGGFGKTIRGLTFDANQLVYCVGSSGDSAGSSYSRFESVRFKSNKAGTFAISGSSSTAVAGMFTGNVFDSCVWDSCSSWVQCGNNQDDVTFINPRFNPTRGDNTAELCIFNGQGIKLINPYMAFSASGYSTGGVVPAIRIGTKLVSFDGLFAENAGTQNITHLFFASSPTANLEFNNTTLNLGSSTVALIRSQSSTAAATIEKRFRASGIIKIDANSYSVLSYFTQAGNTTQALLEFFDVETMPSLAAYASGSAGTFNGIILKGQKGGTNYNHYLDRSGNYVRLQTPDIQFNEVTTTTASSASPSTFTYTLPGRGCWLISVAALVNGSFDHMMSGVFLSFYTDVTNDSLSTQQVGITVKATGSSFGLNTLTAGNPSSTGDVTLSASWTNGSSYAVKFIVRTTKLSSFSDVGL